MNRRIVAIIPARLGSHRLPRKLLLPLGGRTVIEHVWRRVSRCKAVDDVLVATDSAEIARCVEGFGGKAVRTSSKCPSGTDRVNEALQSTGAWGAVNVQGDEPFISAAAVDKVASQLKSSDGHTVFTLARRERDKRHLHSPNVVKVVTGANGDAIYFSRTAVPFANGEDDIYYEHIGVYGYPRTLLEKFVSWGPTRLERRERLEQLRFLEHGIRIHVITTSHKSLGIDTAADLKRAAQKLRGKH
jgi:3-deoxy-manno-octulosonate cytidylyltransferase (CMP-KDO synthetase)